MVVLRTQALSLEEVFLKTIFDLFSELLSHPLKLQHSYRAQLCLGFWETERNNLYHTHPKCQAAYLGARGLSRAPARQGRALGGGLNPGAGLSRRERGARGGRGGRAGRWEARGRRRRAGGASGHGRCLPEPEPVRGPRGGAPQGPAGGARGRRGQLQEQRARPAAPQGSSGAAHEVTRGSCDHSGRAASPPGPRVRARGSGRAGGNA